MSPFKRALTPLFACLVLGPLSGPTWAADPFYLGLLREGRLAYDRQDYVTAVRHLRLACFGFLEEPDLLAEGLLRLGVAQGRARDEPGFRQTFRRVLEVEERFGAYRRAEVPEELRRDFEDVLLRWIPDDSLAGSPFEPLLARQQMEALQALPPPRRQRELEARISQEPRNPAWHLLLAELHFAQKRLESTLRAAEEVLSLDPESEVALCLRGASRVESGLCTDAARDDLVRCPQTTSNARYAAALLSCHVEREEWWQANEALLALPEEIRRRGSLARLARRVERIRSTRPELVTPPQAPEGLPLEAQRKLSQARALLVKAQDMADLEAADALAKPVADAHSQFQEAQLLVAEIAYRASRWSDAVAYFQRAGEPTDDQPHLLFYLAVSLYESGDGEAAARILKRCLPSLQRSAYLNSYVEKILGSSS